MAALLGFAMSVLKTLITAPVVVSLTGCNVFTKVNNCCSEESVVCNVAATAIVASVAVSVAASSGDGKKAEAPPSPGLISDARLKQDIRPTRMLDNGFQLYSFLYWNDARTFEGAMALDLLEDERFQHAVHLSPKGYYVVDLQQALGLDMTGDAGQYIEAGRKALEAATPDG